MISWPKKQCGKAITDFPVLQHNFLVIAPVISLLVPCYDFSLKATYPTVLRGNPHSSPLDQAKIPCKFPC
jgi:hypothetical protein